MSDFNDLLKTFGLTPAVKDTSIARPNLEVPVRAVSQVKQAVIVPAITLNLVYTFQVPIIVFQYNYSAQQSFRIINYGELRAKSASLSNCIICIRYRIGTTVHRYQLTGSSTNTATVPSELYVGQLILPNFVIELWQTSSAATFGIVNALSLTTNIIRNPISQDDYFPDSVVNAATTTLTQLQAAINPEALPTTYNSLGSWNSN